MIKTENITIGGKTFIRTYSDKVSHNGKHWQSDVDGNVWEPPTMWSEV